MRTEPLVVAGGRDGIVEAAKGSGLLVLGLSDRWRREGLGATRSAIAKAAPAPVLFVRRGSRPGVFSPSDSVTQFKWSMAGEPFMARGLSGAIRPWSRLSIPVIGGDEPASSEEPDKPSSS